MALSELLQDPTPAVYAAASSADRGAAWERYCAPATCLPDASCACERARM